MIFQSGLNDQTQLHNFERNTYFFSNLLIIKHDFFIHKIIIIKTK